MNNFISVSEARAKLPQLVKKVSKNLDRFFITVAGQPKAAVLSFEELETLEETAEILAIPGARESIKRGKQQIKRRQGVPLEEITN